MRTKNIYFHFLKKIPNPISFSPISKPICSFVKISRWRLTRAARAPALFPTPFAPLSNQFRVSPRATLDFLRPNGDRRGEATGGVAVAVAVAVRREDDGEPRGQRIAEQPPRPSSSSSCAEARRGGGGGGGGDEQAPGPVGVHDGSRSQTGRPASEQQRPSSLGRAHCHFE